MFKKLSMNGYHLTAWLSFNKTCKRTPVLLNCFPFVAAYRQTMCLHICRKPYTRKLSLQCSHAKLPYQCNLTLRSPDWGHICQPSSKLYHTYNNLDIITYIKENTEVSSSHLTPEIVLHLVTPKCELWTARPEDCLVPDPFWAFYWPGGQALTRYLLDNSEVVQNKTVLDVGSGCGASAIAASLQGAKAVIANDICLVAAEAIKLNAALNNANVDITCKNLIGQTDESWDIVVLGDMFYDEEFTNLVADWLEELKHLGKTILIGDPGRMYLAKHKLRTRLTEVVNYELLPHTKEENSGFTHGHVWTFS